MEPRDRQSTDPLRQALRTLPRERASADFTRRLLARTTVATAAYPPHRSVWPRLAAAATLALALLGGLYVHRQNKALEAKNQRQALQLRHLELRRELAELRARVSEPPTLYVGAARDFDVVVELGPWIDDVSLQPGVYPAARQ
jgi:hypothetical protein